MVKLLSVKALHSSHSTAKQHTASVTAAWLWTDLPAVKTFHRLKTFSHETNLKPETVESVESYVTQQYNNTPLTKVHQLVFCWKRLTQPCPNFFDICCCHQIQNEQKLVHLVTTPDKATFNKPHSLKRLLHWSLLLHLFVKK